MNGIGVYVFYLFFSLTLVPATAPTITISPNREESYMFTNDTPNTPINIITSFKLSKQLITTSELINNHYKALLAQYDKKTAKQLMLTYFQELEHQGLITNLEEYENMVTFTYPGGIQGGFEFERDPDKK